MKLSETISKLQELQEKYGDLPVMLQDADSYNVWELFWVKYKVAREYEYPEEWKMPDGYEFILLGQ